jgi:hypothetical protein
VAVEITPLGFKKPDGVTELVKNGAGVIADNAQKAQELLAAAQAQLALANARLGQVEANANAGNGNGPGLSEDPLNPGTYFIASDSPLFEDPENPGYYLF